MIGKCPSCGETVTRLVGTKVPVECDQESHTAIAYSCPHCNVVLGCQEAEVSHHEDVARAIDEAFRKRGML